MSFPSPHSATTRQHSVQFYTEASAHCASVAAFLADGLAANELAIIIATPLHRRAIMRVLMNHQFDAATERGAVVLLDAETTLAELQGSAELRLEPLRALVDRTTSMAAAQQAPVRVYGEMVDLLCQRGDHQGALALERLWEALSAERPIAVMCGYASSGLSPDQRAHVCALHTHSGDA